VSAIAPRTPVPDLGQRAAELFSELRRELARVVHVQEDVLESVTVALLAGGHVLIEGIPGTGKTLFSRAFARLLDLEFKRIQFTNDLMPSDVVGSSIWRPHEERFEFSEGPIFANVVLADELNRTSSRTLSCLLEAMEEGVVSVDGQPHSLPDPFLILATRNPIEFHGTFPIPEAALDRFLARVELGYPGAEAERELYRGEDASDVLAELRPVLQADELLTLRAFASGITVAEPIAGYAYRIVQATREHERVLLGVSPRAAIAWLRAARARALLQGRLYVVPDDLKALAHPLLAHRVFSKGGGDARALIAEIVARTPIEL